MAVPAGPGGGRSGGCFGHGRNLRRLEQVVERRARLRPKIRPPNADAWAHARPACGVLRAAAALPSGADRFCDLVDFGDEEYGRSGSTDFHVQGAGGGAFEPLTRIVPLSLSAASRPAACRGGHWIVDSQVDAAPAAWGLVQPWLTPEVDRYRHRLRSITVVVVQAPASRGVALEARWVGGATAHEPAGADHRRSATGRLGPAGTPTSGPTPSSRGGARQVERRRGGAVRRRRLCRRPLRCPARRCPSRGRQAVSRGARRVANASRGLEGRRRQPRCVHARACGQADVAAVPACVLQLGRPLPQFRPGAVALDGSGGNRVPWRSRASKSVDFGRNINMQLRAVFLFFPSTSQGTASTSTAMAVQTTSTIRAEPVLWAAQTGAPG